VRQVLGGAAWRVQREHDSDAPLLQEAHNLLDLCCVWGVSRCGLSARTRARAGCWHAGQRTPHAPQPAHTRVSQHSSHTPWQAASPPPAPKPS
jgi:hypothetical protein